MLIAPASNALPSVNGSPVVSLKATVSINGPLQDTLSALVCAPPGNNTARVQYSTLHLR